jgi:hypothetical protein
MNSVINNVINYMLFLIWSFCQVLEYKYYTRVEQYETIVENTNACKRQYAEMLVKIAQLEAMIDELSLPELSLEYESDEDNEEEADDEKLSLEDESEEDKEDKEVEQMANEDLKCNDNLDPVVETRIVTNLGTAVETRIVTEVETKVYTDFGTELDPIETTVDTELVDISEETYPVKHQTHNKKGWLKTILFL